MKCKDCLVRFIHVTPNSFPFETVYSHWPEIDVHQGIAARFLNICKFRIHWKTWPNFGDWMLPPSPQHSFGARAPLRAEIGRDCRQVPGRRRIHWISLQMPKINHGIYILWDNYPLNYLLQFYTLNWVCLEVGSTKFHGKAVFSLSKLPQNQDANYIYDTRRKIGPTLDLHHFQRAKSGTPNLTTR